MPSSSYATVSTSEQPCRIARTNLLAPLQIAAVRRVHWGGCKRLRTRTRARNQKPKPARWQVCYECNHNPKPLPMGGALDYNYIHCKLSTEQAVAIHFLPVVGLSPTTPLLLANGCNEATSWMTCKNQPATEAAAPLRCIAAPSVLPAAVGESYTNSAHTMSAGKPLVSLLKNTAHTTPGCISNNRFVFCLNKKTSYFEQLYFGKQYYF